LERKNPATPRFCVLQHFLLDNFDKSAGILPVKCYPWRHFQLSKCRRSARPCYQERKYMDIQSIVAQLRQQAGRIEHAIAALTGLGSQPARRGRLSKRSQAKPASGKKRRRMSAAARARIAAAKKAWWAKQKGKSGSKKGTAVSKKTTGRKPMSAAMRKKLSAMMKARWAQRKAKV
jgi:hypothetical protein